jgi:hypothetical protein
VNTLAGLPGSFHGLPCIESRLQPRKAFVERHAVPRNRTVINYAGYGN